MHGTIQLMILDITGTGTIKFDSCEGTCSVRDENGIIVGDVIRSDSQRHGFMGRLVTPQK
jgi:hypothetical protein